MGTTRNTRILATSGSATSGSATSGSGEGTAGGYLNLALYAFAVIGWELVLLLIEPVFVDSLPGGNLGAALVHWGLTGAGWLIGAALLLCWATRRYGFRTQGDGLRGAGVRHPLARWMAIAALAAACVLVRVAASGGELLAVSDYARFEGDFEAGAVVALVVQNLYYLAEVAVMLLIVAFGQRAGELRFARDRDTRSTAPWGGLLLAVTWGLVHILLQGASAGFYGIGVGVAFGAIYLLAGRSLRLTYPVLAVAFLL